MNQKLSVKINKSRFNSLHVLLIILACTIIFRIPTLFEPWGGDQGVYGYIADGMLDGKVPYRDLYTSTGYGLFFTYAFFFKILGNHMVTLHIADLLATLVTIVLVFYLAYLLFGKEGAYFAAILTALFGSGHCFSCLVDMKAAWGNYWQLSQRETYMPIFFIASILITIRADRKKKVLPYMLIGIFMGIAAIFKTTAIGLILLLIMHLFYAEVIRRDGAGFKIFLVKALLFTCGFIVIQIPFLYYFWINDSLLTMYNAVFVHTSIYAKLSRGNVIANAFMGNAFIMWENLTLWVFSLASIIYLMIKNRNRENTLLVTWAVGTILIVWGQGKFFGYHYLLITAPFSILTSFGIIQFLKRLPTWKESFLAAKKDMVQIFLWIFVVCNILVFIGCKYDYFRWSFLYAIGKMSKEQYYDVFNEYPLHNYSFRSDYDVANYFKMNYKTNVSLRTINCGGDNVIHYLSGMNSSTRFTSTWYLFNPNLYNDSLTAFLRNEFINGIKTEKPDYLLLVYYTMDEFLENYNGPQYEDVKSLMKYISANYTLEKSFRDRRTLFKRI